MKFLYYMLIIFTIIFSFSFPDYLFASTFLLCKTVRCLNNVAEEDFTSPALESCHSLWRRDGFNRRDIETVWSETLQADLANLGCLEGDCKSVTEDLGDDDLLLLGDSLFFSSLLLSLLLSLVFTGCPLSSTPLLFPFKVSPSSCWTFVCDTIPLTSSSEFSFKLSSFFPHYYMGSH